jgi:magnesium transporter
VTEPGDELPVDDLQDAWQLLSPDERLEGLHHLSRPDADTFFVGISSAEQAAILLAMPIEERRVWFRHLPPDDAVDAIQRAPEAERQGLIELLDEPARREVVALLAYAEDAAGGLMSPRFARLRPEMTVDEAISYLRRQTKQKLETIYYAYVLDREQKPLGVVSFRELFTAKGDTPLRGVMRDKVISVPDSMDQEEVARLIKQHGFSALPVVDAEGHMKGIVTLDDIVEVVEREATEDIQKLGGMEALEEPYLRIAFSRMVQKRAGWLAALFLGEMLTATAMAHFEDEIARAVVLALFVPLIISSGGNSGSQATTLVIRAMALNEVKLRDVFRVVRRELATGAVLGVVLGTIGFFRIVLWEWITPTYGAHYFLIAITVMASLMGVVMFGTTTGALLPFILRKVGLDPASASAPFVATLVDVTGLVIYFSVASFVLEGTLL